MRKHFTYIYILALIFLGSCSGGEQSESDTIAVDSISSETAITPAPTDRSPRKNARIKINHIGSYRTIFNDSNKYQYAHAERLGIKPLTNVVSALHIDRPIVKIESCEYYHVDKLTHSLPYLVPEAATLLKEIGRNFIDSLHRRGGDGYKIKVTSLLRTPATIKSLRRVNINASDSSTHKFATTFDISHSNFYCEDSTRTINQNDLKGLLAEVLLDLHRQQRCMIKYEHKTACFHITVTK